MEECGGSLIFFLSFFLCFFFVWGNWVGFRQGLAWSLRNLKRDRSSFFFFLPSNLLFISPFLRTYLHNREPIARGLPPSLSLSLPLSRPFLLVPQTSLHPVPSRARGPNPTRTSLSPPSFPSNLLPLTYSPRPSIHPSIHPSDPIFTVVFRSRQVSTWSGERSEGVVSRGEGTFEPRRTIYIYTILCYTVLCCAVLCRQDRRSRYIVDSETEWGSNILDIQCSDGFFFVLSFFSFFFVRVARVYLLIWLVGWLVGCLFICSLTRSPASERETG